MVTTYRGASGADPDPASGNTTSRQELLNLRQVAELLALDPVRLYRLGHYLNLAPGDRCIPPAVVTRARAETDTDTRYRVVLDWLRSQLPGNRS